MERQEIIDALRNYKIDGDPIEHTRLCGEYFLDFLTRNVNGVKLATRVGQGSYEIVRPHLRIFAKPVMSLNSGVSISQKTITGHVQNIGEPSRDLQSLVQIAMDEIKKELGLPLK